MSSTPKISCLSFMFGVLLVIGLAFVGWQVQCLRVRQQSIEACTAGRTLAGCISETGPPNEGRGGSAGGFDFTYWPSRGWDETTIVGSSDILIVSQNGIIREVYNLDRAEDREIFDRRLRPLYEKAIADKD